MEKVSEVFHDEVAAILESEEQVVTNGPQVVGVKKAEVDSVMIQ